MLLFKLWMPETYNFVCPQKFNNNAKKEESNLSLLSAKLIQFQKNI